MRKKTKRNQHSTEEDIFKAEYMQALNEKFKLRSQLGALMNQLEELRARNERLVDSIQEKENPEPPPPPPPPPAPAPVLTPIASTSTSPPLKSSGLQKSPSPTKAIQTDQPEPPPLFRDDPIKGLPMITKQQPLAGHKHIRDTPSLLAKPIEESPDEGIDMATDDDDVVVVVEHQPRRVETDNEELQEELERLRARYNEITYYAVVVIFVIFIIIFLYEMRLLMVSKSGSGTESGGVEIAPQQDFIVEDDGIAGIDEVSKSGVDPVELKVKFEALSPPESVPSIGTQKILLKPAEPREAPIIQIKCGELEDLVQTQYDCDECNKNLFGERPKVLSAPT